MGADVVNCSGCSAPPTTSPPPAEKFNIDKKRINMRTAFLNIWALCSIPTLCLGQASDSLVTKYIMGKLSYVGVERNGIRNGKYTLFDENGDTLEHGIRINNSKEGTIRLYKKGVLLRTDDFWKGQRHGASKTYYPNGSAKSQTYYVNGNKMGKHYELYENGVPKANGQYDTLVVSGQRYFKSYRSGRWMFFHPNGRPSAVGNYNKKLRSTVDTFYTQYFNEETMNIKTLFLVSKEGLWRYYDENGEPEKTEYYEKGIRYEVDE